MSGPAAKRGNRKARVVTARTAKPREQVSRANDNIFADLGFEAPEEELAKAKLVMLISDRIVELGLTQGQAATRMGITQPKVSKILRGDTSGVATAWLMKALLSLGKDVEICVRPAATATGHLYVFAC
jgi:predicted XRE-type DNA-binding protein